MTTPHSAPRPATVGSEHRVKLIPLAIHNAIAATWGRTWRRRSLNLPAPRVMTFQGIQLPTQPLRSWLHLLSRAGMLARRPVPPRISIQPGSEDDAPTDIAELGFELSTEMILDFAQFARTARLKHEEDAVEETLEELSAQASERVGSQAAGEVVEPAFGPAEPLSVDAIDQEFHGISASDEFNDAAAIAEDPQLIASAEDLPSPTASLPADPRMEESSGVVVGSEPQVPAATEYPAAQGTSIGLSERDVPAVESTAEAIADHVPVLSPEVLENAMSVDALANQPVIESSMSLAAAAPAPEPTDTGVALMTVESGVPPLVEATEHLACEVEAPSLPEQPAAQCVAAPAELEGPALVAAPALEALDASATTLPEDPQQLAPLEDFTPEVAEPSLFDLPGEVSAQDEQEALHLAEVAIHDAAEAVAESVPQEPKLELAEDLMSAMVGPLLADQPALPSVTEPEATASAEISAAERLEVTSPEITPVAVPAEQTETAPITPPMVVTVTLRAKPRTNAADIAAQEPSSLQAPVESLLPEALPVAAQELAEESAIVAQVVVPNADLPGHGELELIGSTESLDVRMQGAGMHWDLVEPLQPSDLESVELLESDLQPDALASSDGFAAEDSFEPIMASLADTLAVLATASRASSSEGLEVQQPDESTALSVAYSSDVPKADDSNLEAVLQGILIQKESVMTDMHDDVLAETKPQDTTIPITSAELQEVAAALSVPQLDADPDDVLSDVQNTLNSLAGMAQGLTHQKQAAVRLQDELEEWNGQLQERERLAGDKEERLLQLENHLKQAKTNLDRMAAENNRLLAERSEALKGLAQTVDLRDKTTLKRAESIQLEQQRIDEQLAGLRTRASELDERESSLKRKSEELTVRLKQLQSAKDKFSAIVKSFNETVQFNSTLSAISKTVTE
ncbi:hypothetical protein ACLUTX_21435 [Enterobacterales bacterium AE_CKDN230030158-1A_HGKHYDSX7]